jgi:flagellar basal-body rod protein FlgC
MNYGLLSALDIAGSGMSAQGVPLNTVASNLANADSVSSSIDQTYRARVPVFAAMLDEYNGGEGAAQVQVKGILESPTPVRREYRPGHPMADAEGYVYMPNVNVIEQYADMISASRSYEDNVEMANTVKTLAQRTLDLGRNF